MNDLLSAILTIEGKMNYFSYLPTHRPNCWVGKGKQTIFQSRPCNMSMYAISVPFILSSTGSRPATLTLASLLVDHFVPEREIVWWYWLCAAYLIIIFHGYILVTILILCIRTKTKGSVMSSGPPIQVMITLAVICMIKRDTLLHQQNS
jgi:hypothetical protein